MSTQVKELLYTGRTRTTGVLQARARSADGRLDVELSAPGSGGRGTNPEQMLAAGWSACFVLSMNLIAQKRGLSLPEDTSVDAEVDLCNTEGNYDGRFFIRARFTVGLPGMDQGVAREIVDAAHDTCPYAEATRGNVDVTITLS
ncbi:organic hydroperoxide resistance protein [Streptomyces tuirus]|uniref:Organic hydroperoxide resistance protein n=1 Tax=Streptomyces tuirus TaxID=68278 RepID=A0A941J1Q2_9ACTN|nr:organic hydroperoxide resistance protein [Streptomyces tuirus]